MLQTWRFYKPEACYDEEIKSIEGVHGEVIPLIAAAIYGIYE